jgi:hypothetical protein
LRLGPARAGRWHASIGAKGFTVGVSRVTSLSGNPIGWSAYIDAKPLNRMINLHWHHTIGRYRW